jgi:hypothetical protein
MIDARPDYSRKMQWHAHCGTRAQLRNLRQRAHKILDSKDPEIVMIGQRVIEATKDEPNPLFGALHLINAGLEAAEQTETTWVVAMRYLLDEFERIAQRGEATTSQAV